MVQKVRGNKPLQLDPRNAGAPCRRSSPQLLWGLQVKEADPTRRGAPPGRGGGVMWGAAGTPRFARTDSGEAEYRPTESRSPAPCVAQLQRPTTV